MSKKMPPEFYTLLEEIQAIDFVIAELNLYLTHPNNFDAIQQFNENTEKV
ncbi:spore coat peptide assembly protein [Lysinibacillus fusiformis ZC1]|nr:spore coat peptide assembly protein [Lysinibacillus fusiformis ZC1]